MKHLVQALTSFNAKERFWLVVGATGRPGLSEHFREALADSVGVAVPSNAWWAMDFHLDWLEAALISVANPDQILFNEPEPGRNLNRNQEDVDLVVAWDSGDATRLVFVEAKGVTSWGNAQYGSKIARLIGLFGAAGGKVSAVDPAFILASPSRPQKLGLSLTPSWALDGAGRPKWIPLRVPSNLRRPERCDAEGKQLKDGTSWRVVVRKIPGASGAASREGHAAP